MVDPAQPETEDLHSSWIRWAGSAVKKMKKHPSSNRVM